ncbi:MULTISPECIES: phospholipase D family protein [unclassified Shinella]|uniref:phospholipase D family protein n=1 Tax=unclassified Shinella TaxID=2643062 RepID=UPI00234E55A7|nr:MULTISPECIES: phospholipase D family protein [unclassified Shinella]MDC7266789.1 phospholipase D family protein [Shinella sp. HY16]MDC7273686.1 phospholipase D family protein [Shinella sp. YZ44]
MPAEPVFNPENRELYTSLVRAPDQYRFDNAAATTYSLDFETALTIPIAIVFRDAENRDEMLRSPLALLQSVERMAGRMAIYCDRGRIKEARPNAARLMALYEKTIIEVSAPEGGAFHPKLWCIRFQPEQEGQPTRMRLAILSRSLTNDRCWDLALCLDGKVGDDINDANEPVVQLLRALPGLANSANRPPAPKFLPSLARDLEHCFWDDLPAGATKVTFAVNGLKPGAWSPQKGERLAVLSPFVSSAALAHLAKDYEEPSACQLVARAEELDCIKPEIRELFDIRTLDDRATRYEEEDRDEIDSADLEGLHAKAYVVERGSRLHIHLGSANATSAALIPGRGGRTQNVEIMATLDGPKSRMGSIAETLFSDEFQRLLTPYVPSEPPGQDAAAAAEKVLENLRIRIAALPLDLHCTQLPDAIGLELVLSGKISPIEIPAGVRCFVRPITVANERGYDAAPLLCGTAPRMAVSSVPLSDVTRWLGMRLRDEGTGVEIAFTLGARLIGLPDGRDAAVLRAHIANVENFFRYLSLLLGSLGEGSFLESETAGEGQWLRRLGQGGNALLEPMVRALTLGGGELAEIDHLIKRLDDGGKSIVPEDFLQLWASFAPLVAIKGARK